ncbi:MAG: cyclic nucleotide-binding domain-containing protein [Myxococcales bacterium]|nr:cyclic nucleotide-binding domain-containing protein [Myxococcales bacterium]MCB9644783.1 cyclic nucleotide-binding domain-containing protein [Myxococcales bacterium]
MSTREAMRAVGDRPGSVRARVRLASELQGDGIAQSVQVWEAAAKVAAAKGEFFHALAICRLHLPRQHQGRFLEELVRLYRSPMAAGTRAPSGYMPRPIKFQIPLQEQAMFTQAVQLGTNMNGILPATELQMPSFPVFGEVSDGLLLSLLQNIVPVPLRAGDALILQGQRDQSCFLLTHGRFRVVQKRDDTQQEVLLAQVMAPDLVGEISLLTRVSRRASVIAEQVSLAWRLDGQLLENLGRQDARMLPEFRKLLKHRLVNNLLRSNPLFGELDETQRQNFLRSFDLVPVDPNAVIIQQRRPSPGLFILLHGKAVVAQQGMDGRNRAIAERGEGQAFGAESFLYNRPSATSVVLPEGGLVLRLNTQTFQQLQRQIPGLDRALQVLAQQKL